MVGNATPLTLVRVVVKQELLQPHTRQLAAGTMGGTLWRGREPGLPPSSQVKPQTMTGDADRQEKLLKTDCYTALWISAKDMFFLLEESHDVEIDWYQERGLQP